MAPLEEGRQKKAKPGLAKRAVSLHVLQILEEIFDSS